MKKVLSMILLAAMLLALSACGGGQTQNVELTVFAAASMTETLTEIKTLYEKDHPGVTLTFNFDSSGTLLTQIKERAECDLFISAAPKQMNALDEAGALAEGSRINQSIHLLGRGGDEQVALRALVDLREQGTGGIEVERQGHAGVFFFVQGFDFGQGLGHGGGCEHRQFHVLGLPAAAGGERQQHRCQQNHAEDLFHCVLLLFSRVSERFIL